MLCFECQRDPRIGRHSSINQRIPTIHFRIVPSHPRRGCTTEYLGVMTMRYTLEGCTAGQPNLAPRPDATTAARFAEPSPVQTVPSEVLSEMQRTAARTLSGGRNLFDVRDEHSESWPANCMCRANWIPRSIMITHAIHSKSPA